MTYRTGSKMGRLIYRVTDDGDDELIGIMDEPYLGELVVEALNARERVVAARGTSEVVPPSRQQVLIDATCGRVGMHNCGVTGRWQSHDSGNTEPPPGSYP